MSTDLAATSSTGPRLVSARVGALRGTVLELGPGNGVNFADLAPDVRWIGLEPDVSRRGFIVAAAARLAVPPQLIAGHAEDIALPTASVDAVLATRVLCSVRDPRRVLAEVSRVLRPGGMFVFSEHVAAPRGTWLRAAQKVFAPISRWCDGGCDPGRDTEETLRAQPWQGLEVEHVVVPGPFGLGLPHIAGSARR